MRRYIFADESGNFDFNTKPDATRFFSVGTVAVDGDDARSSLNSDLQNLKYELALQGQAVKGAFHATEDRQAVRDEVFKVLVGSGIKVDATVLDKRKAQPHIRSTDEKFYKYAWYFHFNAIAWQLRDVTELVVVCSSLGTKKKATAFREGLEDVIAQKCPAHVKRTVLWWRDESDHGLQAADYMLWAIMRDKERGDSRSRDLIRASINTCFEPFAVGKTLHY